jgi:hypothetical protein
VPRPEERCARVAGRFARRGLAAIRVGASRGRTGTEPTRENPREARNRATEEALWRKRRGGPKQSHPRRAVRAPASSCRSTTGTATDMALAFALLPVWWALAVD